MIVHFLFDMKEEPFGGANQFLKSLKKSFVKKGIYDEDPNKADIILFNSFPFNEEERFKQAFRLKKKGKLLVHRVDGPISEVRGKDFKIDRIIYKFNELLADGTIFQSDWSQKENLKLGMKKNQNQIRILNAPDKDVFNPEGKIKFSTERKIRLISSSWSSNWRKGFRFYKFLDDNLDYSNYKMTFIGNSPIHFKNIKWIRPLRSDDLAKQLKQHDIFITGSESDPCSNSLIEALHCNLPALALKSGGHPEIIGDAGRYFENREEIISNLEKLVKTYHFYQKKIKLPDINEVSNQYMEFMKKIYEDFKLNTYKPKKIKRFQFIKLKIKLKTRLINELGFMRFLKFKIKKLFKYLLLNNLNQMSQQKLSLSRYCRIKYESDMNDINWIYNLKDESSNFLKNIRGKVKKGFYHYTLSGDFIGEKIRWGLGNTVFFLKIIYTLNLTKEFKQEILDAINFILRFQRRSGEFYDPIVKLISLPFRVYYGIKRRDFSNLRNQLTVRAETRQTYSALLLFGIKPKFEYKKFPQNKKSIEKFLIKLNWELPWSAGSHFSHLLFFLKQSSLKNKEVLIEFAVQWVNKLQREEDGFWYKNNPSMQQKINGAMKIITGLKVVNRIKFRYPKKIIDSLITAKNNEQACDNFNIVYVLKYCNELTHSKYRFSEIVRFLYTRLDVYKKYYFPKIGGFSFYINRSNDVYYGAIISKSKKEPDIHGTVMFLWGISLIGQILNINEELKFQEFIT